MKRASITYTKNNLSRVLGMVREGNTIYVVDRDVPVARIEPVAQSDMESDDSLRALERKGIVTAPRRALDVPRFMRRKKVALAPGASAVRAVIEEREESR